MDRSNHAVFVYLKLDKCKCLYLEEAKKQEKQLIEKGWVHYQTIDAASLIEGIYNRDVIGQKDILNNCPYIEDKKEAWLEGVIWAKNRIFQR